MAYLRSVVMAEPFVSPYSIPASFRRTFTALFCLAVLCGCGADASKVNIPVGNGGMPISKIQDGLSPETAGRIRWDYDNLSGESPASRGWVVSHIAVYYGTYNEFVVVMMGGGTTGLVWNTVIGKTLFLYNSGHRIIAWRDGRFYELIDLYNQGLLTNGDLRNIAYDHHGIEINLENHPGLGSNMSLIVRTYSRDYLRPYFPEAGSSDAWIERYYGSYKYHLGDGAYRNYVNDYVAVMMAATYDDTYEPWEEAVAGTLFSYSDGNRILLWKSATQDEWELGIQGRFYELQEAYDLGLLTEDDVRSIA